METFRISDKTYSKKLTASGKANRWNLEGEYVIYTGSSRSLSTLELVVHRNSIKPKVDYKVMVISFPDDDDLYKKINVKNLPVHWRKTSGMPNLQQIGSEWYRKKESLILKVPSVIIPYEFNYVINTRHPDFHTKVSLVRNEDYFWDKRLF